VSVALAEETAQSINMGNATVPYTVAKPWQARPSMFASTILTVDVSDGCQVGLIGLPDDTGVSLNNGRPGAKHGPQAFRDALSRYGTARPAGFNWPRVFDAGDVVPAGDIHETHDRVTAAISALLDLGLFPIAIGGGHDLTFPHVRAIVAKFDQMSGVYFDAHLDVRAETGSGMAFRRIIEDCGVSELHVQGFRPFVNDREHLDWFSQHGGRIEAFGPHDSWPPGNLFVSLDLDVISSAYAPGVSAPNPNGWNGNQCEEWVSAAAREPRVRCFDIMELNPMYDVDGRTARLAAHLFLCFLRGFGQRDGTI
jgi:formiminoglutamase